MRQTRFVRHTFARLTVGLVAVLVTVLGSAVITPGSAQASTRSTSVTSASRLGPSYAQLVLRYTNRARAAHGLSPLRPSSCLNGFASRWTSHMAARQVLVHQNLWPVLDRCSSHRAAENIAVSGSRALSPAGVVSAWMHSREHRANILDRRLHSLGVAAYRSGSGRVYVTQDFAG